MQRITDVLEKVELESYTSVIHDDVIEEWVYPYTEEMAIAEERTTSAKSSEFFHDVADHRARFLNFFELTGDAGTHQLSHTSKSKLVSSVMDQLSFKLSLYIPHLNQKSGLPFWDSEIAKWLFDYLNGRMWSRSRDDILDLIKVFNHTNKKLQQENDCN